MSSISNVGSSSSINPLTPSVNLTPASATGTASSTSTSGLPFETYADILGVPLVGGSLGLPTGGAPGDTEALLLLVEMKLRQTVGQSLNNADQSNANKYAQSLAQAQALIATIVKASQEITTSQIQYQQDAVALSKDSDKLETLYAPLTGSRTQQDITKVTADATGGQGDYGKYLAALQSYQGASATSSTASSQVTADQTALANAQTAASKTDPTQYYTKTYLSLYNQQQSLTQKQSQLAALTPPQSLSAQDAATLATLNGSKSVAGSVANALDYYTNTLQAAVTTASNNLTRDQGAASTALNNLVAAEKALIPYLDQKSGSTFVDNHPQSGSPVTYSFDPNALTGTSYSTTGIISSEINPINDVNTDIGNLKKDQTTLAGTISNDQAILSNAQNVLLQLTTLISSLSTTLSQSNADETTNSNVEISSNDLLDHRFDRTQTSVEALADSQSTLLLGAEIRRRAAAALASSPIQTALALITDVTDTLAALADLTIQPQQPSSSDAFASTAVQSGAPRLRIPV